jgi:hypothetical protein
MPATEGVGHDETSYRLLQARIDAWHIVPGHDPEVMRRYPAPWPELEGIVRLDVAPHQGAQP